MLQQEKKNGLAELRIEVEEKNKNMTKMKSGTDATYRRPDGPEVPCFQPLRTTIPSRPGLDLCTDARIPPWNTLSPPSLWSL